jgi:DNA-binding NtrC family response regulator
MPLPRDFVVIGNSRRMQFVLEFVRVIAAGNATVLVTGESGTGKDVIAHLIHDESRRSARPFVAVSCATLNAAVIESELFGHERGAFTDAVTAHRGRFEQADGGTLFLDDIDDAPLSIQVKLLRALQTRTIERIGGRAPIPVNVRVIAGSKHDLSAMVAAGTFRDDLLYRLNVLSISLPPLRERHEDVGPLMDHFLARFFAAHGRTVPSMSPQIREAFLRYPWPGNVRELENACERIAQTCTCGRLRGGCLPIRVLLANTCSLPRSPRPHADPAPAEPSSPAPVSLDDRLRDVECALIRRALRESAGNKSRAADLLHIHRSTLMGRIHRCRCAPDVDAMTPEALVASR